jgi:hypothetical protein
MLQHTIVCAGLGAIEIASGAPVQQSRDFWYAGVRDLKAKGACDQRLEELARRPNLLGQRLIGQTCEAYAVTSVTGAPTNVTDALGYTPARSARREMGSSKRWYSAAMMR